MKLKIAADIHMFGADPLNISMEEIKDCDLWLGDIFDRKNCLRKNLIYASHGVLSLEYLNFVSGNHELIPHEDFIIKEDYVFCHGDFPLYGYDLAMKRRSVVSCTSKLKRFFCYLGSKFRSVWGYRLSESDKRKLYNYAISKHPNAKGIVIGHCHPKKIIREMYCGMEIIVLPRGITELEI